MAPDWHAVPNPYGDCGSDDKWTGPVAWDGCKNKVQLKCKGYARLEYNGKLVGHCPYAPSHWTAQYRLSDNGCVFMRVVFCVEDAADKDEDWCTDGKVESWDCQEGLKRECWEREFGEIEKQWGPEHCDPEDSIARDDPYVR